MPQVLIDISRLLYLRMKGMRYTGIDRVGVEYLRHFGDQARAVLSWHCFAASLSASNSALAFETLLVERPGAAAIGFRLMAKASIWEWLRAPGDGSLLFNTGHTWLENRGYSWLLRQRGARPVFFIHDLIPISHPEYCRPSEIRRHPARMRNALLMASGIVVNSRHTLETLEHFARGARLRMPPAVVAPLAPAVAAAVAGPRPMDPPYFVILGTIEPRKNHWLLLQVWRQLVERHGDLVPKLVVIGQRGWECENVVDLLERCEPLKGHVFEKSACSDAEVATFLHHAQALLMPSFAEGYGLPVAEALAAGVPVIASDLPAFREIAGGIPEYADPVDGERWAALIEAYARPDEARRRGQLQRIAGFQPTTWAQHFEIVDRFLERIEQRSPA